MTRRFPSTYRPAARAIARRVLQVIERFWASGRDPRIACRVCLSVALFLGAGAIVYLLQFAWEARQVEQGPPSSIVVTAKQLQLLRDSKQRVYGRSPSDAEFIAAVGALVDEEILYQEGKLLGLVWRDPVIQRRLQQNMAFVGVIEQGDDWLQQALDLGLEQHDVVIRQRVVQQVQFQLQNIPWLKPDDQQLQRYMETHREAFLLPSRTSLRQVYFNPAQRGAHLQRDIEQARQTLARESDVDTVGDGISLPAAVELASHRVIAGWFGQRFASGLDSLEQGVWQGPLQSVYGSHLVKVTQRTPATLPPLSVIRKQVYLAWVAEQRKQALVASMQQLRKRYQVNFEQLGLVDVEHFADVLATSWLRK
jgi:hypothetical protein